MVFDYWYGRPFTQEVLLEAGYPEGSIGMINSILEPRDYPPFGTIWGGYFCTMVEEPRTEDLYQHYEATCTLPTLYQLHSEFKGVIYAC